MKIGTDKNIFCTDIDTGHFGLLYDVFWILRQTWLILIFIRIKKNTSQNKRSILQVHVGMVVFLVLGTWKITPFYRRCNNNYKLPLNLDRESRYHNNLDRNLLDNH